MATEVQGEAMADLMRQIYEKMPDEKPVDNKSNEGEEKNLRQALLKGVTGKGLPVDFPELPKLLDKYIGNLEKQFDRISNSIGAQISNAIEIASSKATSSSSFSNSEIAGAMSKMTKYRAMGGPVEDGPQTKLEKMLSKGSDTKLNIIDDQPVMVTPGEYIIPQSMLGNRHVVSALQKIGLDNVNMASSLVLSVSQADKFKRMLNPRTINSLLSSGSPNNIPKTPSTDYIAWAKNHAQYRELGGGIIKPESMSSPWKKVKLESALTGITSQYIGMGMLESQLNSVTGSMKTFQNQFGALSSTVAASEAAMIKYTQASMNVVKATGAAHVEVVKLIGSIGSLGAFGPTVMQKMAEESVQFGRELGISSELAAKHFETMRFTMRGGFGDAMRLAVGMRDVARSVDMTGAELQKLQVGLTETINKFAGFVQISAGAVTQLTAIQAASQKMNVAKESMALQNAFLGMSAYTDSLSKYPVMIGKITSDMQSMGYTSIDIIHGTFMETESGVQKFKESVSRNAKSILNEMKSLDIGTQNLMAQNVYGFEGGIQQLKALASAYQSDGEKTKKIQDILTRHLTQKSISETTAMAMIAQVDPTLRNVESAQRRIETYAEAEKARQANAAQNIASSSTANIVNQMEVSKMSEVAAVKSEMTRLIAQGRKDASQNKDTSEAIFARHMTSFKTESDKIKEFERMRSQGPVTDVQKGGVSGEKGTSNMQDKAVIFMNKLMGNIMGDTSVQILGWVQRIASLMLGMTGTLTVIMTIITARNALSVAGGASRGVAESVKNIFAKVLGVSGGSAGGAGDIAGGASQSAIKNVSGIFSGMQMPSWAKSTLGNLASFAFVASGMVAVMVGLALAWGLVDLSSVKSVTMKITLSSIAIGEIYLAMMLLEKIDFSKLNLKSLMKKMITGVGKIALIGSTMAFAVMPLIAAWGLVSNNAMIDTAVKITAASVSIIVVGTAMVLLNSAMPLIETATSGTKRSIVAIGKFMIAATGMALIFGISVPIISTVMSAVSPQEVLLIGLKMSAIQIAVIGMAYAFLTIGKLRTILTRATTMVFGTLGTISLFLVASTIMATILSVGMIAQSAVLSIISIESILMNAAKISAIALTMGVLVATCVGLGLCVPLMAAFTGVAYTVLLPVLFFFFFAASAAMLATGLGIRLIQTALLPISIPVVAAVGATISLIGVFLLGLIAATVGLMIITPIMYAAIPIFGLMIPIAGIFFAAFALSMLVISLGMGLLVIPIGVLIASMYLINPMSLLKAAGKLFAIAGVVLAMSAFAAAMLVATPLAIATIVIMSVALPVVLALFGLMSIIGSTVTVAAIILTSAWSAMPLEAMQKTTNKIKAAFKCISAMTAGILSCSSVMMLAAIGSLVAQMFIVPILFGTMVLFSYAIRYPIIALTNAWMNIPLWGLSSTSKKINKTLDMISDMSKKLMPMGTMLFSMIAAAAMTLLVAAASFALINAARFFGWMVSSSLSSMIEAWAPIDAGELLEVSKTMSASINTVSFLTNEISEAFKKMSLFGTIIDIANIYIGSFETAKLIDAAASFGSRVGEPIDALVSAWGKIDGNSLSNASKTIKTTLFMMKKLLSALTSGFSDIGFFDKFFIVSDMRKSAKTLSTYIKGAIAFCGIISSPIASLSKAWSSIDGKLLRKSAQNMQSAMLALKVIASMNSDQISGGWIKRMFGSSITGDIITLGYQASGLLLAASNFGLRIRQPLLSAIGAFQNISVKGSREIGQKVLGVVTSVKSIYSAFIILSNAELEPIGQYLEPYVRLIQNILSSAASFGTSIVPDLNRSIAVWKGISTSAAFSIGKKISGTISSVVSIFKAIQENKKKIFRMNLTQNDIDQFTIVGEKIKGVFKIANLIRGALGGELTDKVKGMPKSINMSSLALSISTMSGVSSQVIPMFQRLMGIWSNAGSLEAINAQIEVITAYSQYFDALISLFERIDTASKTIKSVNVEPLGMMKQVLSKSGLSTSDKMLKNSIGGASNVMKTNVVPSMTGPDSRADMAGLSNIGQQAIDLLYRIASSNDGIFKEMASDGGNTDVNLDLSNFNSQGRRSNSRTDGSTRKTNMGVGISQNAPAK